MVAQFDHASLQKFCTGLAGEGEPRSRGIVRCSLKQSEVYDNKRHALLCETPHPPQGKPFVWNFILETDGGTEFVLTPEYGNCYVACTFGDIKVTWRTVYEKLKFWNWPITQKEIVHKPAAVAGPSSSTAAGPSSSTAAAAQPPDPSREYHNI